MTAQSLTVAASDIRDMEIVACRDRLEALLADVRATGHTLGTLITNHIIDTIRGQFPNASGVYFQAVDEGRPEGPSLRILRVTGTDGSTLCECAECYSATANLDALLPLLGDYPTALCLTTGQWIFNTD